MRGRPRDQGGLIDQVVENEQGCDGEEEGQHLDDFVVSGGLVNRGGDQVVERGMLALKGIGDGGEAVMLDDEFDDGAVIVVVDRLEENVNQYPQRDCRRQ